MDKINFIEVNDPKLIDEVATLANRIWNEHFTPIIGKAQVDYMLANIQSPAAIGKQIKEDGYCYFLLQNGEGASIGYLGFAANEDELFLSKLYIALENRGRGYARQAVQFLEAYAKDKGCAKITLTVNKNNIDPISAYEKMGFSKTEAIVQDIGGGFVMDDYRMEKVLA